MSNLKCIHCGKPFSTHDDAHTGYKVHVHRTCVGIIIHRFGYGKIKTLPEWMNNK